MTLIIRLFNGYVAAFIAFGLFAVFGGDGWPWADAALFGLLYVGISLLIAFLFAAMTLVAVGAAAVSAQKRFANGA